MMYQRVGDRNSLLREYMVCEPRRATVNIFDRKQQTYTLLNFIIIINKQRNVKDNMRISKRGIGSGVYALV